MDFKKENDLEREFYNQDFSAMKELLERIRGSLASKFPVKVNDLNLKGIFDYDYNISFTYITLFQAGMKPIRWGACRKTLEETINRDIQKLKTYKTFPEFEVWNDDKCRIMIEYVTEQIPTKIEDIKSFSFVPTRFEPGITGLKLVMNNTPYIYMPTDAWTQSQMDLKSALNTVIKKTPIKNMTNKISERISILKQSPYDAYILKSRAFVTYKEDILPLYRGNILQEYSPEEIRDEAIAGADWIVKNIQEDGRYLYYYDCKDDNYKDHEHPNAPEDNLYYNDLRHCGGIITLIRAYQLTKDRKYLDFAKRGIDFITTITQEHEVDDKPAAYVFYNSKAKLGGTAMILVAMMKYRNETNDRTYDEYIKKYTRHLLSRIYKTGEMLGYYINPNFQNGQPLLEMSEEERRATFSFYYPGEALLGLALFANYFKDDEELRQEVLAKSEVALDWIVEERPKIYADLFTSLPSDSWLMQAIEEWTKNPKFQKENYINFVFGDADTMVEKTYKRDDSPYIDFEGGYYYEYGDHFYPDGARSEGLVAAYYLARFLGNQKLESKYLEACRKTAQSQMLLFNSDKNNYAHLNPEKSKGSIRFKATRQWVRVDSIQHVACFFLRLYFAEKNIEVL